MKVYITKYALTQGIIEAECSRIHDDGYCHAYWTDKKKYRRDAVLNPRYYETCKVDAVIKADEMRRKKIESLKKQIEKLEKLKFE